MQTAEVLIPILVPLGAFAMVFGIVYLKSRENMAMIERGLNQRVRQSSGTLSQPKERFALPGRWYRTGSCLYYYQVYAAR